MMEHNYKEKKCVGYEHITDQHMIGYSKADLNSGKCKRYYSSGHSYISITQSEVLRIFSLISDNPVH